MLSIFHAQHSVTIIVFFAMELEDLFRQSLPIMELLSYGFLIINKDGVNGLKVKLVCINTDFLCTQSKK